MMHMIFSGSLVKIIWAGFLIGYLCYDCFHYLSHHYKFGAGYLANMKKYHIAHHYKDGNLGYGITNKIWDLVYRTELKLDNK